MALSYAGSPVKGDQTGNWGTPNDRILTMLGLAALIRSPSASDSFRVV